MTDSAPQPRFARRTGVIIAVLAGGGTGLGFLINWLVNRGWNQCTTRPCAAPLLNAVGYTTHAAEFKSPEVHDLQATAQTDTSSWSAIGASEDIFGPFEAGFSAQQNFILEGLGCTDGNLGHVVGGIDVNMAEQMVAHQCNITLPRYEGGRFVSLLDECGGHTREYHFHEKLSCLYKQEGAHSAKVGSEAVRGSTPKLLYGKWEDFSTSRLPRLDACGGHFGATPDSAGEVVYHYHVQKAAPFTFGCYGPDRDAQTGREIPVTVARCRELYAKPAARALRRLQMGAGGPPGQGGCGDGKTATAITPGGKKTELDLWCPCWDGAGSNVGTAPLAIETLMKSNSTSPALLHGEGGTCTSDCVSSGR